MPTVALQFQESWSVPTSNYTLDAGDRDVRRPIFLQVAGRVTQVHKMATRLG